MVQPTRTANGRVRSRVKCRDQTCSSTDGEPPHAFDRRFDGVTIGAYVVLRHITIGRPPW